MPRGKVPHSDPPTIWNLCVPTSLAARVDLLLFNPITRKTEYGARTKLVTRLLTEWLEKQKEGK